MSEATPMQLGSVTDMVTERISTKSLNATNYISTENMLPNRGGITAPANIPDQRATKFKEEDTLFSNIRTYFRKVWFADRIGGASPDVIVFRSKDTNVCDSKFLYYLISSERFIDYTVLTAKGAKMPRGDKEAMSLFEFPKVDIDDQREIGRILKTLDDKIALNRKLNETLEGMARALFQSWFVDFDPVKAKLAALRHGRDPERACMAALSGKLRVPPGKPRPESLDEQLPSAEELDEAIAALDGLPTTITESLASVATHFPADFQESELGLIPEGWEVKPFSEVCEINPRRTLKKGTSATYVDMKAVPTSGPSVDGYYERDFTSGSKFIVGDTLLARITPCLENGKTAYVDFLKENEVGWGSTEFIVIRPKKVETSIGYFLARSDIVRTHAINNMTGTSGRQRVPSECFDSLLIAMPEETEPLDTFGNHASSALSQIKANSDQSRTLAELRDTLLPKLLSGELTVGEAETKTEEALA